MNPDLEQGMHDGLFFVFRWSVESVFEKNLLSNLQILLSLIEHYSPDGKILLLLPKIVSVNVVEIQRKGGLIESRVKPIILLK